MNASIVNRQSSISHSGPGVARFGEVVIVGGGCYGTFYARQLGLARERGRAEYGRLLVVDRDPGCQAARELGEAEDRRLVVSDWDAFFDQYLSAKAGDAAHPGPDRLPAAEDVIVPSPLMPHLMYRWLVRRAGARWPGRVAETRPLPAGPGTPWDRAAPDGTRYVSFVEWTCPTHCIEPAICPVTRAPRTWEMAETLRELARNLGAAGPVLFRCEHQVFGVGTFSVTEVLAGDALVRQAGDAGHAADVLVGTISSCHGAVNLLHVGPG
jgi:hypothetical protein